MTGQLAFDLPVAQTFRREDFFTSPANAAAFAMIKAPTTRHLLLIGPHGAGKSHLLHIWARLTEAEIVTHEALPQRLPDLARDAAIAVDNADAPDRDEAAFFHLYNTLAPSGRLLLTATTPPRDWGLTLPDLASRMQATALTRLDPPDDALLTAVLAKLFADRQLVISPNLIPYLVVRMDRSIAAARILVEALDARALSQHRPITRAMAGEILDIDATE